MILGKQFPELPRCLGRHKRSVMLEDDRRRIAHFCCGQSLVFVEREVIGAEGVAEHVSRPRGEFREDLQPLMSFAVGCRHNRSSDLRQRHQPSGKIVGNGNNAPLAGFRLRAATSMKRRGHLQAAGSVCECFVHVQPAGCSMAAIFSAFSELQGISQYQELIDLS